MTGSTRYRPDIDGLRAVAILVVVLYHAGFPAFRGGFVGVDVFFVISGFLITQLLRAELRETGTLSLRDFYARRVRRLLPALLAVLAATLLAWVLFLPGLSDAWKFSRSLRWSLFGLANLYFKRNTEGYFDGPSGEMPLLHLWSLGVEEQFYLVWPLLLLLSQSAWIRRRFGGKTPWFLFGSAAVLTLGSFVRAETLVARGPANWAFYEMPARAWELGIGALTAFALDRERETPFGFPALAAAAGVGLAALILPVFLYSATTPFPGASALAPVVGTALLLWIGAIFPGNPVSLALAWRPAVRIGLLSYGWYLWHWPLLAMAQVWNLGVEPPLPIRASLIAAALGLAALSLRFVEAPIRSGGFWRTIPPFRMIAIGAAASGFLMLLGAGLPPLEKKILSLRFGAPVIEGVWERPAYGTDCFDEMAIGTSRCDFAFSPPGRARSPRIAVWGDSHACSYFPMLTDYARTHGIDASLYCAGRTPPLLPQGFGEAVIRDLARKIASSGGAPVSVALVARWMLYSGKTPISSTTPPGFLDAERTAAGSLRAMAERLERSVAELTRIGVARILIILPYPEFRTLVFRCLVKGAEGCAQAEGDLERYRAEVREVLESTAKRHPNARVFDPFPSVCSNGRCPIVDGDLPLVVDDNHPTVKAVERMGIRARADLDWLVGAPPSAR